MKWIFLLGVIIACTAQKNNTLLTQNETQDLIQKAQDCLVQFEGGEVHFCTGMTLDSDYVEKILKSDIQYCHKEIENNGYQVILESHHQKIDQKTWKAFYNTTKIAETLHSEKLVLFKKSSNKVTCVHELLHVKQWTSTGKFVFLPKNREEMITKFKKDIQKDIKHIEELEKKQDQTQLEELALKAQSKINQLKEITSMSDWLDEKDVYYFFYKVCQQQLTCSKDDWDTIYAQLFRLREKLPWPFVQTLRKQVASRLANIQKQARSLISLPPRKENISPKLFELAQKDHKSILQAIQKLGVSIYYFDKAKDQLKKQDSEEVPLNLLKKYPSPEKEQMRALVLSSHKDPNFEHGRYLCDSDFSRLFITALTTRTDLLFYYAKAEYLKNYPQYCEILYPDTQLETAFKRGEVVRQEFEQAMLHRRYQKLALDEFQWKMIMEIAQKVDNKNILKNAVVPYLLAEFRANPKAPFESKFPIDGEFAFNKDSTLPEIKVEKDIFILDLGAMDSVVAIETLLKMARPSEIETIAVTQLQDVSTQKYDTVKINLHHSLNIGGNTLPQTNFLIKDFFKGQFKGVIGLDFFQGKDFEIHPKKGLIRMAQNLMMPKDSLNLQRDSFGRIRALEIVCSEGTIIRLDTGSEVWGDINIHNKALNKLMADTGLAKCGNLEIKGEFNRDVQNDVIFSNKVSLNLGWPWIKQFEKISVSLTQGKIFFHL